MNRSSSSIRISLIALFSALMIAGTFIRIPLGPVPIVLTTLFILGSGAVLGPLTGSAAVLLYLLLGAAGLPVFSAGGGAALFLGPTGGFLVGYLPAAFITGLIIHGGTPSLLRDILGLAAGTLMIYLPGVSWLAHSLDLAPAAALKAGCLPFLPGDILKAALLIAVLKRLRLSAPDLFAPRSPVNR